MRILYAIGRFFRDIQRMMDGRCIICGGHVNRLPDFGPSHCRRPDGMYVWCPSCHAGCERCAAEDER